MKKNKIWNKLLIFSLKVSLKLSVKLKPESQKNLSLYGRHQEKVMTVNSLSKSTASATSDQKSRTGDKYSVLI